MLTETLASGSVPLPAAPFFLSYPQFVTTPVPRGSDAIQAWIGNIQPFASDEDSRSFLIRVSRGLPCHVDAGTLIVPPTRGNHLYTDYLSDMVQSCRVLILEQPQPAHPRAYLLSPIYDLKAAVSHPHPRMDQLISYEGFHLPGMCIYSAAEQSFSPERDRLVQYVDLVTTHVARHLIWLKTRSLYKIQENGKMDFVRPSRVGEIIPVKAIKNEFWIGHWPGKRANATDARGHVQSLNPDGECWCGTGDLYRSCHLPKEQLQVQS